MYKMRIEINPRSLLNLEHICEVLYKLHPIVLDELVEMERSLGGILGLIDLNNPSLEEREFLADIFEKVDFSEESESKEPESKDKNNYLELVKMIEHENDCCFYELKNLKLDTNEYIPMKISVEVEDPIIGKKVKELVHALEKTRAMEEFYFNKREMDEYAYFAEGYRLTMNKEQKKQYKDFLDGKNVKELEKLLRKKNLFP